MVPLPSLQFSIRIFPALVVKFPVDKFPLVQAFRIRLPVIVIEEVLKLPPDQDGITMVPLLKVIAPPENVPVVFEFVKVRLPLVMEMLVEVKLVMVELLNSKPPTFTAEFNCTAPMETLPAAQSEILIFPVVLVIFPVDKLPAVQFEIAKLPVMVMVEVLKAPPDQLGMVSPPLLNEILPDENVPVVFELEKEIVPLTMLMLLEEKLVIIALVKANPPTLVGELS